MSGACDASDLVASNKERCGLEAPSRERGVASRGTAALPQRRRSQVLIDAIIACVFAACIVGFEPLGAPSIACYEVNIGLYILCFICYCTSELLIHT